MTSMAIARVSGERPFVASWQAYGGHTMFVGAFPSSHGGEVLLATDQSWEAAGFATPEACAAAVMAAGFKVDGETWVDIGPMAGQLSLF